ncbi:hypothetical protein [Eggerthella sinensis]|uniref:hypothetical protein n=1 Tax=Eggerthella sinensis TaxID=242230 RepID=UPI0022E5A560|nr:hypothetical protein [Eggerthella sinensis]
MKNVEERRNRSIARESDFHATMRAPHIDKTAISRMTITATATACRARTATATCPC